MMGVEKIIIGFVCLILGLALIGVVATQSEGLTEVTTVRNESFDTAGEFRPAANGSMINLTHIQNLTNAYDATNDWQSEEGSCDFSITLFALDNGTAATVDTDYNYTADGVVALYNTTFWWEAATQGTTSNTTLVTYTYCGDDYVVEGWQRNVTDMIAGFFAIALMLCSIGIFWSIAREAGIA